MRFICNFWGVLSCVFVAIHRVLKNKCDLFLYFSSLGLHYLCSSCVRVCLSLLISIFSAHFQHAHANGLFNNGLHFRKVSDAVFYLHLSGIGKYKGLMDIVFLYLQKNTLFLRNGQIKTTLFL